MNRIQRVLLSLTSGILLSLAWLGLPGWILFVAFIPLLILDEYFERRKDDFRSVSFWGHSFLAFLTWNGLSTWWIMHATVVGAIMAILVNSFLMSLVWWLAHLARRNFRSNLGYIALIAFWLSFEYFHYNWDIEWPWLNLGNGFANNVKLVQWYEFTGTLGGSLWVLLINIMIIRHFHVLKSRNQKNKMFAYPLAWVIIFLLVPILYSLIAYKAYSENENPVSILVVQPNVNPYAESYTVQAENDKKLKFLRLAKSQMDDSVDLILGPETIFERYNDWNEANFNSNPHLLHFSDWLQKYPDAEILFGVSTSKVYPLGDEATPTARMRSRMKFDVFNSAVLYKGDGKSQVYHKSILVSGVEKVPFMKYLGFLKNIFIDLGGASGNLGSQDESSVFVSDKGLTIAPVICYESVFGEYVTSYIKKGAGIICIITNDGWWKNTPGYRQHWSFARLRAIETRRSIARAANTGISGFITQKGDVLEKTGWWVDAALKAKLNVNDKITFYVKYGDYVGRVSLFLSVLLMLFLIVKRFKLLT